MKKLLILIIIPFLSFGQGWIQLYGIDGTDSNSSIWTTGKCVESTTDGGYIVAIEVGDNVQIAKIDAVGDIEWNNFYDWCYGSSVSFVQQTTAGGYIVSGYAQGVGDDCDNPNNTLIGKFLLKLDSSGNEEWLNVYSESNLSYNYEETIGNSTLQSNCGGCESGHFRSVKQTLDGGFIAVGSIGFNYQAESGWPIWSATLGYLMKIDFQGNLEWEQSLGVGVSGSPAYSGEESSFLQFDHFNDVSETLDGGYIACGWSVSNIDGVANHYVVKTDNNGNKEWEYINSPSGENQSVSIRQTSDGGYIVGGYDHNGTNENGEILGGAHSGVLYKLNNQGDEEWYENIISNGEIRCVQTTDDDNYIVIGNGDAITLIKVDDAGEILWNKNYFNYPIDYYDEDNYANSMINEGCDNGGNGQFVSLTNDGGYILTGNYNVYGEVGNVGSYAWYPKTLLIKTDANGCINDYNNNGICDELESGYDCDGNCILDSDDDGICDENENNTIIDELVNTKQLIKTIDLLGRKTTNNKSFQLQIYDDGSIEKKYLIK